MPDSKSATNSGVQSQVLMKSQVLITISCPGPSTRRARRETFEQSYAGPGRYKVAICDKLRALQHFVSLFLGVPDYVKSSN